MERILSVMKLDQYLTQRGMTDAAFAEKVGRSQSSINRIRRGETRPDWKTMERIVEETGGEVSPNDFLGIDVPEVISGDAA